MEIIALNNQSLFDIALIIYGSAEGAFQLAYENDLSVTDDLVPRQVLQYSPANMINKQVVEYYRVNSIRPATGLQGEGEAPDYKIFTEEFTEQYQ